MKTSNFIDKTKWPERGPWDLEPDKAQWIDEVTGLQCLAVRGRSHWCGYVGVPEGHPAFGKDEGDVNVSVHGGLTFAAFCQEHGEEPRVCHVPEPGHPDMVWWIGFDCAHSGDRRPITTEAEMEIKRKYPIAYFDSEYRTLEYVRSETALLAKQLMEMA